KEGILEVFLREHSSEVINMLLEEWNMEDALRVKYEEGIEQGIEQGWRKGVRQIVQNMVSKGASIDEAAEAAGLSAGEIQSLLSE
ncbi:MAG: hypothetical protein LBP19_09005, partial [Treponema sp.]|nr:hypothetical protein [Treponema sp.]